MGRVVQRVMGTVVSIDVVGLDSGDEAVAAGSVMSWLHHVDAVFSVHRADSVVSRAGRSGVMLTDLLPGSDRDDLCEVIERCESLRVLSDGVFDAWAVQGPDGVRFDPSGYVKGWAVTRAADILRAAGATGWCINAGGDISVGGLDATGCRWRIGLQHPDHRDGIVLVAELPTDVNGDGPTAAAIATSGSYERGAHVVDARFGTYCTELGSATVAGPSLAEADAFATVVYAMGAEGLAWLAGRAGEAGYEGCIVTRDGRLLTTPGFDLLVPAWRHPVGASPLP